MLRRLLDKGLISEAVVDNLLSWHHSGFSAHGAVCVQDREGAVRLGRYMIRCPIVLERLAWDEGAGQVVCRSRPARRSGPLPAEVRWDVLEFLARGSRASRNAGAHCRIRLSQRFQGLLRGHGIGASVGGFT